MQYHQQCILISSSNKGNQYTFPLNIYNFLLKQIFIKKITCKYANGANFDVENVNSFLSGSYLTSSIFSVVQPAFFFSSNMVLIILKTYLKFYILIKLTSHTATLILSLG